MSFRKLDSRPIGLLVITGEVLTALVWGDADFLHEKVDVVLKGTIEKSDWKLWMCDQTSGRDFLYRWGSESEMRKNLSQHHEAGRDVWLIDPDGRKHLPQDAPSTGKEF